MTEKPEEVIKIEAAADRCDDIYWWKKRLNITGWVMYAIGGFMWIALDRPGAGLILLMALALLVFNSTVIEYQLSKRRHFLKGLINGYKHKNAVPLYHDLLEKFADQPHLHIHLNDDGTIVINDRSKKS